MCLLLLSAFDLWGDSGEENRHLKQFLLLPGNQYASCEFLKMSHWQVDLHAWSNRRTSQSHVFTSDVSSIVHLRAHTNDPQYSPLIQLHPRRLRNFIAEVMVRRVRIWTINTLWAFQNIPNMFADSCAQISLYNHQLNMPSGFSAMTTVCGLGQCFQYAALPSSLDRSLVTFTSV